MTIIESKVTIKQPAEAVFNFLADLNNHQQLMPENIYNWSSTANEARFTIQNMAKLALKIGVRQPNTTLQIVPAETPPFNVQLNWLLNPTSEGTEVTYQIEADLNMMMKMIVAAPLQKLVDFETSRLAVILA